MLVRTALWVFAAFGIAACGANIGRYNALDGIGPTFTSAEVSNSTAELNLVFQQFYSRAGVAAPARGAADWDEVILAGMDYVDERCEIYMDALHWYNRANKAAIQEISIVSSAASTLVALTSGSNVTLGILAAVFGLASETVDNTASALLYKMDPSAVRAIVDGSRQAYRRAVANETDKSRHRSKARASTVMRNYLSLCLPAGIERQINAALTKQNFGARPSDGTGLPTVVPTGTGEDDARDGGGGDNAVSRELRNRIAILEQQLRESRAREADRGESRDEDLTKRQNRQIQAALCLATADGVIGNDTNAALKEFRRGLRIGGAALNAAMSPTERNNLLSLGNCAGSGYVTAFERAAFGRGRQFERNRPENVILGLRIDRLKGLLALIDPNNTLNIPKDASGDLKLENPTITDAMRGVIAARRAELGVTGGPSNGVTDAFVKRAADASR